MPTSAAHWGSSPSSPIRSSGFLMRVGARPRATSSDVTQPAPTLSHPRLLSVRVACGSVVHLRGHRGCRALAPSARGGRGPFSSAALAGLVRTFVPRSAGRQTSCGDSRAGEPARCTRHCPCLAQQEPCATRRRTSTRPPSPSSWCCRGIPPCSFYFSWGTNSARCTRRWGTSPPLPAAAKAFCAP